MVQDTASQAISSICFPSFGLSLVSREKLGQGIMSEIALGNIEDGKAGWTKVIGDTLLQRMGVSGHIQYLLSILRAKFGEGILKTVAGSLFPISACLLQRMGVSADYFEVVASAGELDRWRMREDICMLMPFKFPALCFSHPHLFPSYFSILH